MLNRTPFYDLHKQSGAKLIDFGGWEMPVRYDGIKQEHKAVRESVGIFDVSHMGEFYIHGPEALQLIQYLTINDAAKLAPGKAQYSAMCYEDGGIVDDLLVYKLFDENEYMFVVNASNIDKDLKWIRDNNEFDAEVVNNSPNVCLLAVQGPKSIPTLQKLTDTKLSKIKYYNFHMGTLAGIENIMLSATGYTGEKGFELYFDKNTAEPETVWSAIIEAGDPFDIQPCGLGARDTLRMEMGFALYGNDLTKDTTPLEAGMGWLTKLDRGDFIGLEALQKMKKEGVSRKLMGLVLDDPRAIPRPGYEIFDENEQKIGYITSGTRSISLGRNIGMGYVSASGVEEGSIVYIKIRSKVAEARMVKPPFLENDSTQ